MHRLSPLTHSAERSRYKYAWRPGFTIVELLIVVVVIAILATITIVAYNGITAQAKEAALKSNLKTAATQLELESARSSGSYPSSQPDYIKGDLAYTGGGNSFCITGSANGKDFHVKEAGSVEEGDCSPAMATTLQTFTQSHCSALDTFTGSNNSAVVSLTDSRGGTTRTYEIAKLADGKCWMLTNLKLGSTSGSITLTPADSNVASNFTLPQLTTGGASEFDLPRANGPVDNDPGNYGYLYNFAAATAGETRTSLTTGNAQHSICPASWRLPTGGGGSGNDFGDLDIAFGGTGNGAWSGEANIAKWQPSGPFRGSFSGDWNDSFDYQGGAGFLWSASAYPGSPGNAFNAAFGPGNVGPGGGIASRGNGLGVRCLLQ